MKNTPYSTQEKKIFDALVGFVDRYQSHNGLYVLMGDRQEITRVTFRLNKKDRKFLETYGGRPLTDALHHSLKRYSTIGDGVIAVDPEGIVFDDHRSVRTAYPEQVDNEFLSGTGHVFLASASLNPAITAFVCSAEKGTVKAIKAGSSVKDMHYTKAARIQ
jgi:hypothetical protein